MVELCLDKSKKTSPKAFALGLYFRDTFALTSTQITLFHYIFKASVSYIQQCVEYISLRKHNMFLFQIKSKTLL